jgi:putative ABC transport system permease protein
MDNFLWLCQMAWRDSRRHRARMLLFITSIVVGIAALVAIWSFGVNLAESIEQEANELLGADLVVNCRQEPQGAIESVLDSIRSLEGVRSASEINFASMVLFPKSNGTRLVQIRALGGDFPFYGKLETEPTTAASRFRQGPYALVEQTVLLQFGAEVGDSIQVGKLHFVIAGALTKVPGQAGIAATVAPAVYVPLEYIEATGLLTRGSRLVRQYYFALPANIDADALGKSLRPTLREANESYETVAMRKQTLGNVFAFLGNFLNLVAFIALLLGCVGVAGAVHVYLQEKMSTVAVLRCVGTSSQQVFGIFLIQIIGLGLIGAILGASLGSLIQWVLPQVLQSFLPVEVSYRPVLSAWLLGILIGVGVSVLFAALPLLAVRKVSPLQTIRAGVESLAQSAPLTKVVVYGLIVLFVSGFTYSQLGRWRETMFFVLGLGAMWGLLSLTAWGVMRLVRLIVPAEGYFVWRQGLANLYRPNNQTQTLMLTLGLGTALISTLYLIQQLLLGQVSLADRDNQPNMILFDIQSTQLKEVREFTESYQLPVLQLVPIVTMRLEEFQGRKRNQWLEDSTADIPRDVLVREYRVTHRDTLAGNEALVAGRLHPYRGAGDSIFVSLSDVHARRMGAKLGDELVFDVQGVQMKTYVGSLRQLNLTRIETSFTVVFPSGVLDKAPQFHVLITRVPDKRSAATFQQALVAKFPNVSIVDLDLILQTADKVLGQISFVIQFMAFFSILTGLVVLVSSLLMSRLQRIRESVLLRTLGASRPTLLRIYAVEFFLLGNAATLTGLILALGASALLAKFVFLVPFNWQWLPLLWLYAGFVILIMSIGLLNTRGILQRSPLAILRTEVA